MKRHIIFSFLVASLLVTMAGCKKGFLDVNDNPNSPTDQSVTPNLILPSALHRTAARMATSYAATGRWMGYWARSGTYGPSTEEESYHITTTYEADEWAGWFDILNDCHVMERKASQVSAPFYQAAAKVLKSIGFMYLVDQYNNVPYSTAFDLENNILPTYDKGEDIYADLFVQLDSAIAQLDRTSVSDEIEEFDVLFGGDITMWKKLVNTQRLKLILRLSQVTGFNPATQVAKITSEGFIEAGETGYVQPGYVADANKQNPYWNSFKRLYTGDVADNYNRANNYILNKFVVNNDERYRRVFDAAQTPLNGNTYYGYNYGEVVNDPDQPKAANSSGVAGPGLGKSASQPQWLFTSVESMFLQAEAIQRGLIPGDAEAAYRAAVTESFEWLAVPNAATSAASYLNQAGNPLVEWPASSAARINVIATQKYMALIGINNFEAWVDYRRLGVPADLPLSLSPSRGDYEIPLRLSYPQNEYNYNPGNVAAEGAINPQTSTIFWDR